MVSTSSTTAPAHRLDRSPLAARPAVGHRVSATGSRLRSTSKTSWFRQAHQRGYGRFSAHRVSTDRSLRSLLDQRWVTAAARLTGSRLIAPFDKLRTSAARPARGTPAPGVLGLDCARPAGAPWFRQAQPALAGAASRLTGSRPRSVSKLPWSRLRSVSKMAGSRLRSTSTMPGSRLTAPFDKVRTSASLPARPAAWCRPRPREPACWRRATPRAPAPGRRPRPAGCR